MTESGQYVKRTDGTCGHYNGRLVCSEPRGHGGAHKGWTYRLETGRVRVSWTGQTAQHRAQR